MFAVLCGSYHTVKRFVWNFFECYGKTSTDAFNLKKSIVIRNGKIEILAKLDVHAFLQAMFFFHSALVLLNFFMKWASNIA